MDPAIASLIIAILALLISLVGGIPGAIEFLKYRRDHPLFVFSYGNVVNGEMLSPGSPKPATMVLLTGTLSNEGALPLSPAYFDLWFKFRGKWIKFEKMLIPPDINFPSNTQVIEVSNPSDRDLQRLNGLVTTGVPVNGCLLFVSKELTLEEMRNELSWSFRLECVDVFGKRHTSAFNLKPKNQEHLETGIHFPKLGVTVTPKRD